METAFVGRYATPRSASGIKRTMMRALKITAAKTADYGLVRRMKFNIPSSG